MPPLEATAAMLDVKVNGPWDRAYAGETIPLTLELVCQVSDDSLVVLQNLSSTDPDLQLDIDMLQHGIVLLAGERYRFLVNLKVAHPKIVELAKIQVDFEGQLGVDQPRIVLHQPIGTSKFQVKPSLGQEILITPVPLCEYEEGTKTLLTFQHKGASVFEDFKINMGPAASIAAGKTLLQRQRFQPSDEETCELVLSGRDLELAMSATIAGQRSEYKLTLPLKPPPAAAEKRFRFLEPRRLAQDTIAVFQVVGEGDLKPLMPFQSTYILEGGSQYQVHITPLRGGESVALHGIAPQVHVRKMQRVKDQWQFTIDVTAQHLLRKSERLFYEVDTPQGKLSGEIPICLKQSAGRYWQVAAAVGVALTLQGANAVGHFLHQVDYSLLEAVSDFRLDEQFKLFYVAAIPVAWVGLRLVDWLQYQIWR